jgi:ElaB/YqjD/DUF883 family membrane-anchored ribosome-binding protein
MKTHSYPHHPDMPHLDQSRQPAQDIAQQVTHAVKDAAQHATQTAKDLYQSAATRTEDTLVQSKQYVSANPMAVVLSVFTLGLTLGCMLGLSRHRHDPTMRERFGW